MTAPAAFAGGTPLTEALADELGLASRMLGDLAYDLGSDEATLRRHLTSLQSIDHVTQMLLAIADLLRTGGEGIVDVGLEDMTRRLHAATRDAA